MQTNDERVTAFHRQRRMFAVVKGELLIARELDERDHATWARHEGWVSEFQSVTRGFVDATGVYVYRGSRHEPSSYAEGDLAEHADLIAFLAEGKLDTPIWNGMEPGKPGDRWKPVKILCTVGELLGKRKTVMVPVRVRPEIYERLKNVFLEEGAIARFVRRAVASGGGEKALALLQKECSPHERVKVAAGAQSSELFACRRCGAEWWD